VQRSDGSYIGTALGYGDGSVRITLLRCAVSLFCIHPLSRGRGRKHLKNASASGSPHQCVLITIAESNDRKCDSISQYFEMLAHLPPLMSEAKSIVAECMLASGPLPPSAPIM
jgi:hypothetical protein